MPYASTDELPKGVRDALPASAQRIWMAAYNSASEKYDDEGRRASIAWGAVKNAGWEKDAEGNWHKTEKADEVAAAAALARLKLTVALATR